MPEHEITYTDEQEMWCTRTILKNTKEGEIPITNDEYLQALNEGMVNSWGEQLQKEDKEKLGDLAKKMIQLPEKAQAECVAFLQQKALENQVV